MPETTGPIGRFDHIGIAVFSIDKARTFFEDVLGCQASPHVRPQVG